MTREDRVMWVGRIVGIVVGWLLIQDTMNDADLSPTSRLLVICIAVATFGSVFIRQCQIAYKYEGIPIIPLAFRWVVTCFFGSLFIFVGWMLLITLFPGIYNTWLSTLIWLQFGEASLWFVSRWWTVGRPQLAGPGETGAGSTDG